VDHRLQSSRRNSTAAISGRTPLSKLKTETSLPEGLSQNSYARNRGWPLLGVFLAQLS
jgi:hypothetical protein